MRKVSVIIPAFNHQEFIGEAIASVLNSEHKNLEVIVVDDGSTDRTGEIVSKYEQVLYIRQENKGAHSAINHGLSLASGEFFAILNDDDTYSPQHLSIALNNMSTYGNDFFIGKPKIVGSGAKFDVLKSHAEESDRLIKEMGLGRSLLEINWSTSTSAFVFHKLLFEKMGGFHGFSMCHDLDFLIRGLFEQNINVGVSEEPTWYYRCHETNSGSSISAKKQQAEIVYSLGRALDPVIHEELNMEIARIIGYGINLRIKLLALHERPWRHEPRIGVDQSIRDWIEYCLNNSG